MAVVLVLLLLLTLVIHVFIFYHVLAEEPCDFTNRDVWDDINVLTGALKLFLRELPEPVIPYGILDALVAAIRKLPECTQL